MLRKVRLYGELGARFGRVHELAVGSAAEAVRALGVLLRGFDAYMTNAKDRGVGYAVFYGKRNINQQQLCDLSDSEEIRIAPVLMGAKRGGIFNIILGAILIVAGYFLAATPFGAPLINAGIAMIVGGVVQLLTPTPKGRSSEDDKPPSYNFNGPLNTQAQGYPVPVLYGELIVGSAVLSAGITTEDQAIAPSNTPRIGSGGGGSFIGFIRDVVAQP